MIGIPAMAHAHPGPGMSSLTRSAQSSPPSRWLSRSARAWLALSAWSSRRLTRLRKPIGESYAARRADEGFRPLKRPDFEAAGGRKSLTIRAMSRLGEPFGGMVMDPRHLYRLRLEAAKKAPRQQVEKDRGEPATAEEQQQFDEEVDRLVAEWTEGREGLGLPRGGTPLTAWIRRRRPRRRRGSDPPSLS